MHTLVKHVSSYKEQIRLGVCHQRVLTFAIHCAIAPTKAPVKPLATYVMSKGGLSSMKE